MEFFEYLHDDLLISEADRMTKMITILSCNYFVELPICWVVLSAVRVDDTSFILVLRNDDSKIFVSYVYQSYTSSY